MRNAQFEFYVEFVLALDVMILPNNTEAERSPSYHFESLVTISKNVNSLKNSTVINIQRADLENINSEEQQ